jgi:hypothetical protein
VGFCLFIAVYNVPTFDWTTNIVGLGGIAIGIIPYLASRSRSARYEAILLDPAKRPAPE